MARFFQILAVVLTGVAAFFLWRGNNDALFVSTVLGCIAFFLSYRYQAKERVDKRNAEIIEEKYGTKELTDFENQNTTVEEIKSQEPLDETKELHSQK